MLSNQLQNEENRQKKELRALQSEESALTAHLLTLRHEKLHLEELAKKNPKLRVRKVKIKLKFGSLEGKSSQGF